MQHFLKASVSMAAATTCVVVTLLAFAAACFVPYLAPGIFLGGGAAIVALWLLSRDVRRWPFVSPVEAQLESKKGALKRYVIYACALGCAYAIDRTHYRALAAAAFALLGARMLMLALILAWDKRLRQ